MKRRQFLETSALGCALAISRPTALLATAHSPEHPASPKEFELEELTITELQSGMQSGKSVEVTVSEARPPLKGVKVNFKYYQRIEGKFSVPAQMTGQTLQARFFEPGLAQPKLTQTASLPG